jgi:hypothetical protein
VALAGRHQVRLDAARQQAVVVLRAGERGEPAFARDRGRRIDLRAVEVGVADEAHLRQAVAVDVGGVEERGAEAERRVDHARGGRRIHAAAEMIGADADARHLQPAAAERPQRRRGARDGRRRHRRGPGAAAFAPSARNAPREVPSPAGARAAPPGGQGDTTAVA